MSSENLDFALLASYKITVTDASQTLLELTGLTALPDRMVAMAIIPEATATKIRYAHAAEADDTTSPAWPVDGLGIVPVWPADAGAMEFVADGAETALAATVMLFTRR